MFFLLSLSYFYMYYLLCFQNIKFNIPRSILTKYFLIWKVYLKIEFATKVDDIKSKRVDISHKPFILI